MYNKINQSTLEKYRSINFKIGMLFSLSFVFLAFNWTTYPGPEEEMYTTICMHSDDEIPITRTKHPEPKQLPPPKVEITEKIVEKPPVFVEELPVLVSTDINTVIKKEVIAKPVLKKPGQKKIVVPPPPPLPEKPKTFAPEIVNFAQVMPRMKGCDESLSKEELRKCSDKLLLNWIQSQIKYPELARDNDIDGTVSAQFVVGIDGSISDIKIIREPGGGLGKEAIRVLKKMPEWVPGRNGANKVKVRFNLPVKFRLN